MKKFSINAFYFPCSVFVAVAGIILINWWWLWFIDSRIDHYMKSHIDEFAGAITKQIVRVGTNTWEIKEQP